MYTAKNSDDTKDTMETGWLVRMTYDKANNKMSYESLRPQLKEAIGTSMVSDYDKAHGGDNEAAHFTIAGLPDGVAIVGSSTLGEDTHIIKDDSTDVTAYERTSSYHRAFNPMAAVDKDGYLYVTGTNATEPDIMYFRSTHYTDSNGNGENSDGNQPVRPAESKIPKTGDMMGWLGLLAVVAAVLTAAAVFSRKRANRKE